MVHKTAAFISHIVPDALLKSDIASPRPPPSLLLFRSAFPKKLAPPLPARRFGPGRIVSRRRDAASLYDRATDAQTPLLRAEGRAHQRSRPQPATFALLSVGRFSPFSPGEGILWRLLRSARPKTHTIEVGNAVLGWIW